MLAFMERRDSDIALLESAMLTLLQTIKRPRYWAEISARAKVELDRPAAAILRLLSLQDKDAGVHDVAASLGIEAPSVTRKSQELEEAGLLTRERDSEDRRIVRLRLTVKGRTAIRRLNAARTELLSEVLDKWSGADREHLVRLFDRFARDFSHQSPEK